MVYTVLISVKLAYFNINQLNFIQLFIQKDLRGCLSMLVLKNLQCSSKFTEFDNQLTSKVLMDKTQVFVQN